jgi:hypothetical protein
MSVDYEHGRAELHNGNYLVLHDDGRSWAVMETGQRWDAWAEDEDEKTPQQYREGGRATADEKIRELIGEPA